MVVWGSNTNGQTNGGASAGPNEFFSTPVKITTIPTFLGRFADPYAVQVACGGRTTAVLSSDGKVYAWGNGATGQVGAGCTQAVCPPTELVLPNGLNAVSVSVGANTL